MKERHLPVLNTVSWIDKKMHTTVHICGQMYRQTDGNMDKYQGIRSGTAPNR